MILRLLLTITVIVTAAGADTAAAQGAIRPVGLQNLDASLSIAVGRGGWLYVRVPDSVPAQLNRDGSHTLQLYNLEDESESNDVSCVLIGATLFRETRTSRCRLDAARVHSGVRYALTAGTLPVWAGILFIDLSPPLLNVHTSKDLTGTHLTIAYQDENKGATEQQLFPIAAEGEPLPLLELRIGFAPIAWWNAAQLPASGAVQITLPASNHWPPGELMVIARDPAGNESSYATGVTIP